MLDTEDINLISKYIVYIMPPDDPQIQQIADKKRKTKEDKELLKKYYSNHNRQCKIDLDDFINNKFELIIGESFEELENSIISDFQSEGFSKEDVCDLIYPNAINLISKLSIKSADPERITSKEQLMQQLQNTKKTAITRWTKELSNYKTLLKKRQSQLSNGLNNNMRKRYFFIDANAIEDFSEEIVIFLKEFVDTYCHKPKLQNPALFCFMNLTHEEFKEIVSRLYSKGIEVETGIKGNRFFKDAFLRTPKRNTLDNWMQFRLRVCIENDAMKDILQEDKPDDLFIISKNCPAGYDLTDINVEFIDINNFNELRYLLKLVKEI
ncbi:MAG: hypothetical protein GX962_14350 [Epulopiscium sp.]|nr:hypothetical protein [Candidatus Epulonipiscium sp.]